MTITLPPDQLAWIETRIASGAFSDLDTTVRCLLANAIAEREDLETMDLSWAKPLVDEALAEVEQGEFVIIDDTDAYIDALFSSVDP